MSGNVELYNADRFSLKSRFGDDFYVPPEFDIVPREEWGAKPPRDFGEPMGKDIGVIVATLNTDTPHCVKPWECESTVRLIQQRHLEAGFSDIQYNFLIGCDQRVYEGRGWHRKSCPKLATPEGFPEGEQRLDIAYIGDWRYSLNPADELIDPSIFLILTGVSRDYLRDKYKFFELDKRYKEPPGGEKSPLDDYV